MPTHIDQAWPTLLDAALKSPDWVSGKQDQMRELICSHVVLDGSMEQFCLNPRRRLSPIYASAELLWYLSRERSGDMIKAYAPQYEKFLDEDGTAYGAYGARLKENLNIGNCICGDLLRFAITVLQQNPPSKKCVVALWRPDDLVSQSHKDIPCTLTWQFLLRGEKLHMICSMRSNDLWKGFLYDCYVNTVIQRWVASELGVTAGEYHHVAGSMHLYARDEQKAREAIGQFIYVEPYHPSADGWSELDLAKALACEAGLRVNEIIPPMTWSTIVSSTLRDAVICCSHRTQHPTYEEPRSPGLRLAMDQFLHKEIA